MNERVIMRCRFVVFFTIIALFDNYDLKAQSYSPLVDTNKTWNVAEGDFVWFWSTSNYSLTQDTLIDGLHYKKVYAKDSILNPDFLRLMAFIREDSMKRVYIIRCPDTQSTGETLLYDFGLNVGDTVTAFNYYLSPVQNTWIVSSIDTVHLISGEKRVRWKLQNFSSDEDCWVEGIGSTMGLLFPGTRGIIDLSSKLLCYYENFDLMYKNDSSCFLSNANVDVQKVNSYQIFPTVAKDVVYVNNVDLNEVEIVEIYNATGNVIYRSTLFSNEINVTALQPGFYFIGLTFINHSSYVTKFLKIN